jgi:hypothetical protein
VILGPAGSADTLLARLKERLVGGDTLEKEAAPILAERTSNFFHANALTPFDRPLVNPDDVGALIDTLYYAFAFTETETYIVLDRRHLASIER